MGFGGKGMISVTTKDDRVKRMTEDISKPTRSEEDASPLAARTALASPFFKVKMVSYLFYYSRLHLVQLPRGWNTKLPD
ncbi:hypothetical protein J6590_033439 [Homalodisca vitripennis]|nr:hypothetical protein J6590_033439 [Homalodisca vitripennis]